jgi:hypothetical protein
MIPINLKYDSANMPAMNHSKQMTAMAVLAASMALNLVGITFAEQHF